MVRVPGATQSGVVGDEALAVEIVKAIVHQGHSFFASRLDGVLQLMKIVFADEITDRAVGDDQFIGQHAARAVGRGEEFLRDDALQSIGQLKYDLPLGTAFENADNSLERMG